MQTNVLKYFLLRKNVWILRVMYDKKNVHHVTFRNRTKGAIHVFLIHCFYWKTQITLFIIRNIGTLGHLYPKKITWRARDKNRVVQYNVQDNGKVTKFTTKNTDQL